MRGAVEGLRSAHPLGRTLPALYQDDDFVQRLCSGLDEVLAPVLLTLDGLPAYLDPGTAPEDVLEWLGGWVGLAVEAPDARRRTLVREAVELHRWRGTVQGVRRALAAALDLECDVEDTGGSAWSSDPGASPPGTAPAALTVTVRSDDPDSVDVERVESLVAAVTPAHVPRRVRVVQRAGG